MSSIRKHSGLAAIVLLYLTLFCAVCFAPQILEWQRARAGMTATIGLAPPSIVLGALLFDADTEVVDHGTLSSWDADPMTVALWVDFSSLNDSDFIWMKGDGTTRMGLQVYAAKGITDGLRVNRTRGTKASESIAYNTTSSAVSTTGWHFICATYDSSKTSDNTQWIDIFTGTETVACTDKVDTATSSDGTGTIGGVTTLNSYFGNNNTPNNATNGIIGLVGLWDIAFTQEQCQQIQYDLNWNTAIGKFPKLFSVYGFNGTTSALDVTGNNFDGTITGATVDDGPPMPVDRD